MTYEEYFDQISTLLEPLALRTDDGEDFRDPPLEVFRYEVRKVRLHWLPVLGRALGVVATVRQPDDLGFDPESYRQLLTRVARAAHGRYPPWPSGGPGLVIGLTTIVLTDDPIGLRDEQQLALALPTDQKSRVVPLGLFRINLEQEALAFAIGPSPRDLFPEPFVLADGLSTTLGRFVPPLELD